MDMFLLKRIKMLIFVWIYMTERVMKIKLLGKNLDELKELVAGEGLPGFAAKQIAQWLYVKKVRTIDQMTNLSKAARAALKEK